MENRFLSRWSRLKAGKPVDSEKEGESSLKQTEQKVPSVVQSPVQPEEIKLPSLEDVEKIDQLAPDFSAFMQPGVDPEVQQAALKKMFSDPHFNIMDGLDEYIDDYSKPNPIPSEMLKRMVQSDMLSIFSKNEDQAPAKVANDSSSYELTKNQAAHSAPLPQAKEGHITSSTVVPEDRRLNPEPLPMDEKKS